jgi:hypothetical protein
VTDLTSPAELYRLPFVRWHAQEETSRRRD